MRKNSKIYFQKTIEIENVLCYNVYVGNLSNFYKQSNFLPNKIRLRNQITQGEFSIMNKIQLLQERKNKLLSAGKQIRDCISAIVDAESFVELSAFSFSKNEFYTENTEGEGVITGFATVDGFPFYVVAQNDQVFDGGISVANCDKIVKCLDLAEKNQTPVIYLLSSRGVQLGEGVTVLEGIAKVLTKSANLKGIVPQYAIINGETYGSMALLAAQADFTFFVNNTSVLAINSPFVLSAKSGKNIVKEEVGGAKALDKTGVVAFTVDTLAEIRPIIANLTDMLFNPVVDAELNESVPVLNEAATAENVISTFENPVCIWKDYAKDVQTYVTRIGGIAVAAVVFDGGEDGVELTADTLVKIKNFALLAHSADLPFITFGNVKGMQACASVQNGTAMKEAAEYLNVLSVLDVPKIAVVYKKAIGLGYSLFAAKSAGFDYSCAFANAQIALFDSVQGAKIELADKKNTEELAKKYAEENADPIHMAKDGYIDAIIEPQFVKQHLIASLQMLIK